LGVYYRSDPVGYYELDDMRWSYRYIQEYGEYTVRLNLYTDFEGGEKMIVSIGYYKGTELVKANTDYDYKDADVKYIRANPEQFCKTYITLETI
jgi:hypothetical protein